MRTGVSAEDIFPAEPLEGVDVVVPAQLADFPLKGTLGYCPYKSEAAP